MKSVALALLVMVSMAVAALLAITVADWKLEADFARSVSAEVRRRPPHPFLQVLPRGQVTPVNAAGFRGEEIALPKPPGTFRIVTLGGSTTLGVANPYEESYPFLLQRRLRERFPGRRIEVQNAAAAWYTTAHNIVSYDLHVRQVDPDVVIFFEAINDLARSFSPPWFAQGRFQPDYGHYMGPYARFAGPEVEFIAEPRSRLDAWLSWRMLMRRVHNDPTPFNQRDPDNVARLMARMTPNDAPAFRSLPSYRQFYATLVHDVAADGHAVIVASQPFVYRETLSDADRRRLYFAPIFCAEAGAYPSLSAMIRGMREFNAAARAVADSQHVTFVDLEAAVPKDFDHFSDDVHLRRAGNDIIATRFADAIVSMGLIRP